jgi:hypothetical protein
MLVSHLHCEKSSEGKKRADQLSARSQADKDKAALTPSQERKRVSSLTALPLPSLGVSRGIADELNGRERKQKGEQEIETGNAVRTPPPCSLWIPEGGLSSSSCHPLP